MSHYAGLQIHSSNDIILTSALGKNITLNGKVYNGTGVGLRIVAVQDQLRPPRYIYSTENVELRTDLGKKVIINGTEYVSTTGIARSINPSTRYTKDGVNWYFLGDFTIEVAPGKKIICNDIEITPIPDVPSTATVTSCSPSTLVISSGTSVTVNGTGFTAATVIQANGSPVQTTYVSATSLTTTYLGTVSSIQTIAIGVRKPGELISNTVNFSVTTNVLAPNYVVPANSGYEGYVIVPGDNAGMGNASLPGLVYFPGAGMRVDDVYDNANDNGLHEMLHDIVYALRQPMYCHYKATGDWGNQACIDYFEAHYPTVIGTQMGNNPNQLLLIGASAGGAIAVNFISQNPGKTAKYVGLAPVSDITDIHTNNRGGHAAMIDSFYAGGWSQATYGNTYNPTTVAGLVTLSGFHSRIWYGDVDDICIKATVEGLIDKIPGATKVMIVGGDHGSWQNPTLSPEIIQFLQESTPTPPATTTVTSCTPNTLITNSGTLVTVTGTGFNASTVVRVNNSSVQTTYVSATSLTTTYLGTISTEGTYTVGAQKSGELPSSNINFSVTAPVTGFIPTDVPDCVGWWDANDPSSFTYSSGVKVAQWNDKSSRNYHVANSNTSQQPSRNGTRNGKTTVVWDGNGRRLWHQPATPISSVSFEWSIFVVWIKTGAAVSFESPFTFTNGSTHTPYDHYNANPTLSGAFMNTPFVDHRNTTTFSIWNMQVARKTPVPANNAWCDTWVNGTLYNTYHTGDNTTWNTSGQKICIGGRDDIATYIRGEIAEVVIYNRYLPEVDRTQVESYLGTKWGISTAPPPAPNISSLSPSTLVVNSGTLVTVTGTNFVSGCVVKSDGVGVQTTFVSATSLTTTYLGTVATASTVAITVQNPDTQTSNSVNFILTAAPTGPFDQTAMSVWFDASDAASFTYGTGTQIASWVDKSSNAFTVSRTPSINFQRTGTINGVACTTSDNSAVVLTKANVEVRSFVDSTSFTDCMSFGIMEFPAGLANGAWFGILGASYRVNWDMRGTTANYFDACNSGGGRLSGAVGIGTTPVLVGVYRSGATMKVFVNGTEVLTKGTASGTVAASQLGTLGIGNSIGWVGKLGEIIHISRYDATQFTNIQNYLTTKWLAPGPSLPVTSGLVLWLDADDASSFTLTGSHVEQWRDKSTTGLVYVPSQPAKGASRDHTQNGKSTVYFDGTALTGGMLETPVWSAAPLNNFTRITVSHTYKPPPTASRNYMQDSAMALSHFNAQGQYGGLIPGVAWISVGAETSGSWQIQTLTCNAGTGQFRKDGVNYGSSTGISLGSAANGNYLGGEGWTVFTRCEIAEVIYYNRVLTGPELSDIEGYLKTKWGTP